MAGTWKKWLGLGKQVNAYTEAKAESAFQQAADTRVQIEQATRVAQENHDRHNTAVAKVVGTQKLEAAKLIKLQNQQAQLESQVQMEMTAGNTDKARLIAVTLAGVRQQVTSQQAFVETCNANAAEAMKDAQESQEQLAALMVRRDQDLAQLGQAKEREAYNETRSTTTASVDPTFASLEEKIAREAADAEGTAAVAQFDPNVQQAEINHDQIMADADSILAEFAPKPAAPAPASSSKKGK